MGLKYIVIKQPRTGNQIPIVFPEEMSHHEMVPSQEVKGKKPRKYEVISAGFCELHPEVKVWGKSESLGKGFRQGDYTLIVAHCLLGLTVSLQASPVGDMMKLIGEAIHKA